MIDVVDLEAREEHFSLCIAGSITIPKFTI